MNTSACRAHRWRHKPELCDDTPEVDRVERGVRLHFSTPNSRRSQLTVPGPRGLIGGRWRRDRHLAAKTRHSTSRNRRLEAAVRDQGRLIVFRAKRSRNFPFLSLRGSVARLEPRGSSRPIPVFSAKTRNPSTQTTSRLVSFAVLASS